MFAYRMMKVQFHTFACGFWVSHYVVMAPFIHILYRRYALFGMTLCMLTHVCFSYLGSITLFAFITVILGCLKVAYFIGFSECLSATEGVFPVTHAVHTLLQVSHWCLFTWPLLWCSVSWGVQKPTTSTHLVSRANLESFCGSYQESWAGPGTLEHWDSCFPSCRLEPFRTVWGSCFQLGWWTCFFFK